MTPRRPLARPRLWRRLGRWLVRLALLGLAGLGLLSAALWLEHRRPLELPRPSGSYPVGRLELAWRDDARPDPYAPPPGRPRELPVWIWFPAAPDAASRPADYMPAAWRQAYAQELGWPMVHFLSRDPGRVRAHAFEAPPLASAPVAFPVVVLRSGIGSLALDATTLAEELASHGYVVVACDAPASTVFVVQRDGRVIARTVAGNPGDAPMAEAERGRLLTQLLAVWTADTRFLVARLAELNASDPSGRFRGRLDLAHLGVVGHSFGGATAAQFCHDDARCTAGIDLDGALHGSVVEEGLRQPFLFLLSDHGEAWQSPDCAVCAGIRAVARRRPSDTLIVTLRGSHHFSFSDQALLKSGLVIEVLARLGVFGGLDARRGLTATGEYVRSFLDVQLRGAPPGALFREPLVPEASFEAP